MPNIATLIFLDNTILDHIFVYLQLFMSHQILLKWQLAEKQNFCIILSKIKYWTFYEFL